jgi:AcrR family transcriptional regulator
MRIISPQRDQEMKDRIIAAAEQVFAETGTEKATARNHRARKG